MLFPDSFDILLNARSGIIFHKSPERILPKETRRSHLLNDDDSASCPVCMVRREFETTRSGKLVQRHCQEEIVEDDKIGRNWRRSLEKILPKMRFYRC